MTTSVLMTSEGTYPYYSGGVSVWCDHLIRQAANIDFHLFSIVHSPSQPRVFQLSPNVRGANRLSLWGTEEPGCLSIPFSEVYQRKLATTPEVIVQQFLPAFAEIVRSVAGGLKADPIALGEAFQQLQVYFEEFDYSTTLTSPEAWNCFKGFQGGGQITLEEATTCMRWLVRYLAITASPFPRTDVVHASMAGMAGIPGVLAKLRYRTPFLLSEHGIHLRELYVSLSRMEMSEACRRFLLGWNGAIVRMNYHFADHVTCLGEFNLQWQLSFGADRRKIEFVPNGVDPKRFYPAPESRPARLTVLTLARIYPLKGIDTLLRAAAIVHRQAPQVRFRIFGEVADKEYFAECQKIIAANHLEAVVEFGVTTQPAEAMRAAHVYCLPSISEGLPYSLLEAMFSGCPVVATDVGNIRECLRDTGLLVVPGRPEAMAEALLRLLDGPQAPALRESLSQAALDRAKRHYTLEKSMRPFLTQYEVMSRCETNCQIA